MSCNLVLRSHVLFVFPIAFFLRNLSVCLSVHPFSYPLDIHRGLRIFVFPLQSFLMLSPLNSTLFILRLESLFPLITQLLIIPRSTFLFSTTTRLPLPPPSGESLCLESLFRDTELQSVQSSIQHRAEI